jgi:ribosomal protein S18 acetylase RimI-like enzyme
MLLQRAVEAGKAVEGLQGVALHVQTSNDDARRLYERTGFRVLKTIKNYYRRIDPPDAWFIWYDLLSG